MAQNANGLMHVTASVALCSYAWRGHRRHLARFGVRIAVIGAIRAHHEIIVHRYDRGQATPGRRGKNARAECFGPLVEMDDGLVPRQKRENVFHRLSRTPVPNALRGGDQRIASCPNAFVIEAMDGNAGMIQERADRCERANKCDRKTCLGEAAGANDGDFRGPAVYVAKIADDDDLHGIPEQIFQQNTYTVTGTQ